MGSSLSTGGYRSNGAVSRRLLQCVPLFSSLDDEQLAELLHAVEYRHYPRQSYLISAGAHADGLYVLVAGSAKVLVADGEGREVILSVLGPNDFFGEVALIDGLPQSTSVQALESCQTLYIPRYAFLSCFKNSLQAAVLMLRTVVTRLRNADRHIESFALLDVHGRVARVLSESAREVAGRWIVDIGSQRIALMVAASREMISRVLRRLEAERLIARSKRKIILLDRAALAQRGRVPLSGVCITSEALAAKGGPLPSRANVTPVAPADMRVHAKASDRTLTG
jgi:CRP/FNR family transcriptional regulator, cyclic AMP receptor protein